MEPVLQETPEGAKGLQEAPRGKARRASLSGHATAQQSPRNNAVRPDAIAGRMQRGLLPRADMIRVYVSPPPTQSPYPMESVARGDR